MSFPYHAVPDGNVFLPHDFTYSVLFALLLVAVVRDDYAKREPLLVAVPFEQGGWSLWWLQQYPAWVWVCVVVLVLVGLDDVIQHALGWATPLDQLWRVDGYGLKKLMPSH